MIRHAIILVVAVGLCLGATAPKLVKMAQIKGWVSGATATSKIVTAKDHETRLRGSDAYWVAFDGGDVRQPGPHRLNMEEDAWARVRVGDSLEVVHVPGDDSPYLRDGIFVSDGNFAFDCLLLAGESGVAGFMAYRLWRAFRPAGRM